jgi:hypothetical protein
VWETKEVHAGFWWGDVMERDHLEDLSGVGRIILKCIFSKWEGTGFMWLRIGTGDGML